MSCLLKPINRVSLQYALSLLQVALQFPDELLPDAVRVSAEIENETKAKTYILGDTSYGRWEHLFKKYYISYIKYYNIYYYKCIIYKLDEKW